MSALMPRASLRVQLSYACVVSLTAIAGCSDEQTPHGLMALGDPNKGAQLIAEHGCGSCHQIPGINNAPRTAGPALDKMARRRFITGRLPNTPANMVRWLQDPQAIDPGNAMPDVGLSKTEAQHIAAYLYTVE